MLPEQFKRASEIIKEQLHSIDSESKKIDEEIAAKQSELDTLTQRKTEFVKIKTRLESDKKKLEAPTK